MAGVDADPALGSQGNERVQTAFFTAVFSMMGYVAKADGRVSPDEISLAQQVMDQMRLQPEQRKLAIGLFEQGKQHQEVLLEWLELKA